MHCAILPEVEMMRRDRFNQLAWLLPAGLIAWVFSGLVTSGQQAPGGNPYNQYYPTLPGVAKKAVAVGTAGPGGGNTGKGQLGGGILPPTGGGKGKTGTGPSGPAVPGLGGGVTVMPPVGPPTVPSGGGGGGSGIVIPTRPATLSTVRLRLRLLRTPLNRRLPPARPAMSAISGARFMRTSVPALGGGTPAPVPAAPTKGKATP
ncbi:MAG: hypothetical protein CMO66_04240 [Verrucomicrobiales bacterium]|nr:hypothetical protein [Verrucomicrobiales bacterium]